MGTTYYNLAKPFGNVRVAKHGSDHATVTLWDTDFGHLGTLTLREQDLTDFLYAIRDKPIAHSYYGGDDIGQVWQPHPDQQAATIRSRTLVDEYGRLIAASQVVKNIERSQSKNKGKKCVKQTEPT